MSVASNPHAARDFRCANVLLHDRFASRFIPPFFPPYPRPQAGSHLSRPAGRAVNRPAQRGHSLIVPWDTNPCTPQLFLACIQQRQQPSPRLTSKQRALRSTIARARRDSPARQIPSNNRQPTTKSTSSTTSRSPAHTNTSTPVKRARTSRAASARSQRCNSGDHSTCHDLNMTRKITPCCVRSSRSSLSLS
jgi:hypothetical protein